MNDPLLMLPGVNQESSVMSTSETSTKLRCAAALSTAHETRRAVDEVCQAALDQLRDRADLALLFSSTHHVDEFAAVAAAICDRIGTTTLLGTCGESIVGGRREIEQRPALSLWLASLPGAAVFPMQLEYQRTGDGGSFTGWPDALPEEWSDESALLLLGEPYSFPADVLLERLNEDQPGVTVAGGMASGGSAPGDNRLILGRRVMAAGAVAVLIDGGVRIRNVVSQGCRPIGKPYVVTRAEQNEIHEIGGRAPLAVLRRLFDTLPSHEQQLLQRGLHLGLVINEYQDEFSRGDFLVRNVIGADPDNGSISIGDYARAGQTVQFHLRDGNTADEDLREMLASAVNGARRLPAGALLFTCNGRGTRLFGEPDHDAAAVSDMLGDVPLAGFFAQGEIGPVGGKNFLHGFTASAALFESVE